MKKITKYMAKYWWRYLIGTVSLLIAVVIENITPEVTKRIVDDVIGKGNLDILLPCLGIILAVTLGRTFFQYTKEYNFDMCGCGVATDLRKDLFRHVQGLSVDYFDETNTGEIMSRLTWDIENVWGGIGFIGMLLAEIILHVGIVLFCMFRLSPVLSILPCVLLPVAFALAIFVEKKLDKVYDEISDESAAMNTVAEENISGTRTVKAFARERFEIDKFLTHNRKYYDLNMKQSKVMMNFFPLFGFITKILPVATILIGGVLIINDRITLGTLIAFVTYCNFLGWPVENIGWVSNEMANFFASLKKLKKLAKATPVITNPKDPVILDSVEGHITFDDVSFTVKEKEVLKNVSFDLKPGHTLGIMGATGSGKTSIFTMLFRFYDPTGGKVLLDGKDIKTLGLAQLRSSVAQVSQDVFLFSDTIKENVRFGRKNDTTDDNIVVSLKDAAADFVDELPDRMDTVIGERGVGLSGGQKQRLSIARALSKHAPVLVLDDCTSALDTETEQYIQQTLKKLENTTKIIISHRISAVRDADEIIFLKDGAVSERGTHEELLAKHGLYYETYVAQMGA